MTLRHKGETRMGGCPYKFSGEYKFNALGLCCSYSYDIGRQQLLLLAVPGGASRGSSYGDFSRGPRGKVNKEIETGNPTVHAKALWTGCGTGKEFFFGLQPLLEEHTQALLSCSRVMVERGKNERGIEDPSPAVSYTHLRAHET